MDYRIRRRLLISSIRTVRVHVSRCPVLPAKNPLVSQLAAFFNRPNHLQVRFTAKSWFPVLTARHIQNSLVAHAALNSAADTTSYLHSTIVNYLYI